MSQEFISSEHAEEGARLCRAKEKTVTTTPDPITTARDHFFLLKVFVPSKVTCTEGRIRWYLDHAIRGYYRQFALDTDPIKGMSGSSMTIDKIPLKEFNGQKAELEKLKAERDEALKKLEVAEQAVKRVQSASKAFEIAFTKTHAPDNETVRKADIINATIDSEREMNAILTEELEDVKCRLSVAPILSKYHGRRGFETERFIADYEAWRSASQWIKDRQAKTDGEAS